MRFVIAALLTLALAGCDKGKQDEPQEKAGAGIAKIDRSAKGQEAPATPFLDPGDEAVALSAFRGKPLIVNLWATWCAPCLKEMPSLDALAGQLAKDGGKVQLIAVSVDIEGRRAVTPFFAERKFSHLQPYLDKDNVLPLGVKAAGLPVTLIYDGNGKEVLRVNGPLEWDGAEGRAIVKEALDGAKA